MKNILNWCSLKFFGRRIPEGYLVTGSVLFIILSSFNFYNGINCALFFKYLIGFEKTASVMVLTGPLFAAVIYMAFSSIPAERKMSSSPRWISSMLPGYFLVVASAFYKTMVLKDGNGSSDAKIVFDQFFHKTQYLETFVPVLAVHLLVYYILFTYKKNKLKEILLDSKLKKQEEISQNINLLIGELEKNILTDETHEWFKSFLNLENLPNESAAYGKLNSIKRKSELVISNLKETKAELAQERQRAIEEQLKIFSSIHHELGNLLPALKQDIGNLIDFIELQNVASPGFSQKKIAEPLPGENSSDVTTIAKLANRMNEMAAYSISTILNMESLIKASPSNFQPKTVNINQFLIAETQKFQGNRVNVQFIIEGDESLAIKIDPVQFSFLMHNFISNAYRHGKFDEAGKVYFILFKYEVVGNEFLLEVINNGHPLDPQFSVERFTAPFDYHGTTGNTGLGGYLIGLVIKNHGGRIEIIDKTAIDENYKVCFQISIPVN